MWPTTEPSGLGATLRSRERPARLPDAARERLGDIGGKHVMHMPAATGEVTAELIGLGALVTGIEASEEALAFARGTPPRPRSSRPSSTSIPLQLRRRRFRPSTRARAPSCSCDWPPGSTVAAALEGAACSSSATGTRSRGASNGSAPGGRTTSRPPRSARSSPRWPRATYNEEVVEAPPMSKEQGDRGSPTSCGGREEVRLAGRAPMPTSIVVIVALAAAAFAVASPGYAAPAPLRWCGTDEAREHRLAGRGRARTSSTPSMPSRPTAIDRDPPGRASDRTRPRRDLQLAYPGRTRCARLRGILQALPGCDSTFGGFIISLLRLPLSASAYVDPQNGGGFSKLVRASGRVVPRRLEEERCLRRWPDRSEPRGSAAFRASARADWCVSYAFSSPPRWTRLTGFCGFGWGAATGWPKNGGCT